MNTNDKIRVVDGPRFNFRPDGRVDMPPPESVCTVSIKRKRQKRRTQFLDWAFVISMGGMIFAITGIAIHLAWLEWVK